MWKSRDEMDSRAGTRILVTGGTGFIGSRVSVLLQKADAEVAATGSIDGDLTDPAATDQLFEQTRPQGDRTFKLSTGTT